MVGRSLPKVNGNLEKQIGRLKTRLHRRYTGAFSAVCPAVNQSLTWILSTVFVRVDDNSSTMMEISECVKYLIRLGADRGVS